MDYRTKESVEEYIRLAKGVDGSELIEKLKKFIPPNASVLELGSGPGTDWKILQEDFRTVGSDYSTEFLNHLKSSNPTGHFLELDAVTIDIDENFDGIFSNKVLHHLQDSELVDSIQRQKEILNPNGIICHSFWAGEGSEIFKGLFVNYHTESVLKDLFKDQFDILLTESYAEFEDGDSILLIGRKL